MNLRRILITGCVTLMLGSTALAAGEYIGERNAFNRFHGQGTYKYTNGNVYEGEWVDGRKSGQGTQTWANGEKYTGAWSNNREHGQGTKTWPNGDSYTGEWLQGKMSGQGTYKWANGDTYTGGFIADQKQGQGGFVDADTGIRYAGTWQDDKRQGEFTVTMKNGNVARGVWKNDQPPAQASVALSGGELYSGPVRGGYLPNGKGSCTNDGRTTPCEFRAGEKVKVVARVEPKPKPVAPPAPKPVAKPLEEPKPVPFKAVADAGATTGAANPAGRTQAQPQQPAAEPEPEAPKDPRTKRGERPDGSQFFFKHSWGGYSDNLNKLVVKRGINEFGGIQIQASGGPFELSFTLDEYVGPGTYELKYFKASVQRQGEDTTYRTSSDDPGTLTVLQDGDGMLIGTFSFTGYPYGNPGAESRTVSEGEFAIPL